jgi:hypothetical protein
MRRVRHSAASLSISLLPFTLALCAAAALALPPKAEAAIHLGTPNTVALQNGLVAYWPLDGDTTNWTTGKTSDVSGQGNIGTLTLMSANSAPVIGKIGQALNFNGTSNYIDAGNASGLQLSTTTISVWIKTKDATGGYLGVVVKQLAYSIFVKNNNLVVHDWTASQDRDSGVAVNDGRWHFLVCSYGNGITGGTLCYVDGSLVMTTTDTFNDQSNTVQIGYANFGQQYFNGIIDDARIYNRILSATEIANLYKLGSAKTGGAKTFGGGSLSQGLTGYWPLDGDTTNWGTNSFNDISGNNNSASSTGTIRLSTTTSPVPGKIGGGLFWNGNQLLATNHIAVYDNSVISAAIWVKTTNVGWRRAFGEGKNDSNEKFGFWLMPGGQLEIEREIGGTQRTDFNTNPINDGKWHHIVYTNDASRENLYLDGALASTTALYPGGLDIDGYGIDIGNNGLTGGFVDWSGTLDDARLYNRALSATEVQQLYKSGAATIGNSNPVISNGLVGYWTFDGPSIDWHTNTVSDMSGQGNTGSLISMSTTSSPTPGKIGQALNFNGVANLVESAIPSALDSASQATLCGWIYRSSSNDIPSFGAGSISHSNRYNIVWSGNMYFEASNNSVNGYHYIAFAGIGWHHVCNVFNGTLTGNGRVAGYIDGAAQALTYNETPPSTLASNALMGTLWFGRDIDNGYGKGKLDDVRIYNRALSASEVQQLYNAGR